MTCKDCIHGDLCNAFRENFRISMLYPSQCGCFKDKSKYIELPCKVGDTVYVIKNNKICAKDIVYYNKIHSRVAEQNEEYWHCVDRDRISINVITFYPENIGKTVFLSEWDAEKELRKRIAEKE